jgi:hypothetical protein
MLVFIIIISVIFVIIILILLMLLEIPYVLKQKKLLISHPVTTCWSTSVSPFLKAMGEWLTCGLIKGNIFKTHGLKAHFLTFYLIK